MAYPNFGGKPQFIAFTTPIGLLCHTYHDKPLLSIDDKTKQPILDQNGIQEAFYRVTMAWEKSRVAELQEMVQKVQQVIREAWPESAQATAQRPFYHEPFFRDGDNPGHNTAQKDYLYGKYYLNIKQRAASARDPITGRAVYSGAPGIVDKNVNPIMPSDLYGGCSARVTGTMFGTEYMGKRFISTRLNNIQKYKDGERIGFQRPDAADQFDALPDPDDPFGSAPPAAMAGVL